MGKLVQVATVCFILMIFFLFLYKDQVIDKSKIMNIKECIYNSPDIHSLELEQKNILFKINYVSNSSATCINPNFPSIHILADNNYNGWIHIVSTDSRNQDYKRFIDSNNELFPFYSIDKNFYDAPLWGGNKFNTTITFWEGHVYAVKIDYNKQIITILGGIKWGYKLGNFKKPDIINPMNLTKEEVKDDLLFLESKIKEYNFNE